MQSGPPQYIICSAASVITECICYVLGCIGACLLNDRLAAGGLFVMRSDFRRRGIGNLLWEWRVAYVGERNLSIAAAQGRIEPNKRAGFVHMSYVLSNYQGVPDRSKLVPTSDREFQIVAYDDTMFTDLLEYDTGIHCAAREAFLRQWVSQENTTTLVARCDGKITGYGCVQPIEGNGYQIGPIFADREHMASVLFNNLALNVPDGLDIGIGIATAQPLCNDIVAKHGFQHKNDFQRMYTKGIVDIPLEKVYFITTCAISLV